VLESNGQTDRQIDTGENITSLSVVIRPTQ